MKQAPESSCNPHVLYQEICKMFRLESAYVPTIMGHLGNDFLSALLGLSAFGLLPF